MRLSASKWTAETINSDSAILGLSPRQRTAIRQRTLEIGLGVISTSLEQRILDTSLEE